MGLLQMLVLKNFRIHRNLKVWLGGESAFFLGENAKGKSTIMMGIRYALFGAIDVKLDKIKNRDAGKKEKCFTTLYIKYPINKKMELIEIHRNIGGKCSMNIMVPPGFKDDENIIEYMQNVNRQKMFDDIKKITKNNEFPDFNKWERINLANSTTNINKYIYSLLNIDDKLYSNIIYSKQNEITKFAESTKSEKIKMLDSFIGNDTLIKYSELFKKVLDKFPISFDIELLKQKISEINNNIDSLNSELIVIKTDIDRMTNIINSNDIVLNKYNDMLKIYNDMKNIMNDLSDLKNELKLQEKDKEIYDKKKSEFDIIMKEVNDIITNINDKMIIIDKIYYMKKVIDTNRQLGLEKELNELKSKLDKINIQKNTYSNLIHESNAVINQIISDKNKLDNIPEQEKIKSEMEQQRKILSEEKDNMLKTWNENNNKLQKKTALLELLVKGMDNTSTNVCPVCTSKITDEKRIKMNDTKLKYETEINELNLLLTNIVNKGNEKANKIKELDNKLTNYSDLEYTKKSLNDSINRNNIRLKEIKDELKLTIIFDDEDKKLNEEYDSKNKELILLKNQIKSYPKTKSSYSDLELFDIDPDKLYTIEDELYKLKQTLSNKQTVMDNIKNDMTFNQKEYDDNLKLKAELETKLNNIKLPDMALDTIKENISKIKQENVDVLVDLNVKKNDFKHISNNLEKHNKELQENIKLLNDNIITLEKRKLVKDLIFIFGKDGIPKELRKKVIKLINKTINKHIRTFKFDDFMDGVHIDEETLDIENFDISSGGQKIILSIGFKIAILEVLLNIGLLVLDEPTISLDKKRVIILKEFMSELIEKGETQFISVTHNNTFNQILNAKIFNMG